MSEINLKEVQSVRRSNFEPVELENGMVMEMDSVKNGGKMELHCKLKKEDSDVGSAFLSTESQRLYVQIFPIPMDGNAAADAAELAGTMVDCLKAMIEK